MSIHPSFKSGKSKKHKSVLKRLERILHFKKKDEWSDEKQVFGLPKVKVIKLKIKKEKIKTAEETAAGAATGTEGAVAAEGAAGKSAAEGKKPAAAAKPSAEEKKPAKK